MKIRSLWKNKQGNFMLAITTLLGIMMATIIGAMVFFAFSDAIVTSSSSSDANNTTATVVTYAIIVFTMLAIVPLIVVGGLMLRSLGFFSGGGV